MTNDLERRGRQLQVSAPQLIELFQSPGLIAGVLKRWQARAQIHLAKEGGEYLEAMNLVHGELEKLMNSRAAVEEAILDYEQRVRAVDEIRNNPELAEEMHQAQVEELKQKLLMKARARTAAAAQTMTSQIVGIEHERTGIARERSEQRAYDRVARDEAEPPQKEPRVKFEKVNPEAVAAAVERQVAPVLKAHLGDSQADTVDALVGDLIEDMLAQIEAIRKGRFE